MYKLPKMDASLNKQFLDAFSDENPILVDMIRDWWGDYKHFSRKANKLYQIQYFK